VEYLVINQTDDGPHIDLLPKATLHERLNSDWYSGPFLNQLPQFYDGQFQRNGVIILEVGRLVVPREKKTVTEWELP
jgi:hypothetical protein